MAGFRMILNLKIAKRLFTTVISGDEENDVSNYHT